VPRLVSVITIVKHAHSPKIWGIFVSAKELTTRQIISSGLIIHQ